MFTLIELPGPTQTEWINPAHVVRLRAGPGALFHWPTTVQGVSYPAPPGCTCPNSPLYQRAIERERLRHGNRP